MLVKTLVQQQRLVALNVALKCTVPYFLILIAQKQEAAMITITRNMIRMISSKIVHQFHIVGSCVRRLFTLRTTRGFKLTAWATPTQNSSYSQLKKKGFIVVFFSFWTGLYWPVVTFDIATVTEKNIHKGICLWINFKNWGYLLTIVQFY